MGGGGVILNSFQDLVRKKRDSESASRRIGMTMRRGKGIGYGRGKAMLYAFCCIVIPVKTGIQHLILY